MIHAAARGPILALDTATDTPGVALVHAGGGAFRPIRWRASFRETAPTARSLLAEAGLAIADLGGVAVPAGPGSFTGLRVGATIAVALARAGEIALHAVPTLEAVAEAYAPRGMGRACAILDARRGRWYAALVERDDRGWRTTAGPLDLAPEEIVRFAGEIPSVGSSDAATGPMTRAEAIGPEPAKTPPTPVAMAIARLVERDSSRYFVDPPAALRLVYARSATGS